MKNYNLTRLFLVVLTSISLLYYLYVLLCKILLKLIGIYYYLPSLLRQIKPTTDYFTCWTWSRFLLIIADDKGRAEFKFADKLVKVTDIIGRSIVVAEGSDDLGKGNQPMSKVYLFFSRPFYSPFLFICIFLLCNENRLFLKYIPQSREY